MCPELPGEYEPTYGLDDSHPEYIHPSIFGHRAHIGSYIENIIEVVRCQSFCCAA